MLRKTQGRTQGPWKLDAEDRQALGYCQGFRAFTTALGGRTHLRMARPVPTPGQGLGEIHRFFSRMGHYRLYPNAHTQNRKSLNSLTNF